MPHRLEGAGIVVTRPDGERDRLADLLTAEGARVLPFPALHIVALAEPVPTDPFDAVLFTSPAAVRFGAQRIAQPLPRLRLAPGQGTRAALLEVGINNVFAPLKGAGLATLLNELPASKLAGRRILIVCGRPLNKAGLAALQAHGVKAIAFAAYRREAVRNPHPLNRWLESGAVDVIMASSTAAVKAMSELPNIDLRPSHWIASSAKVAEAIRSIGAHIDATAASAEAAEMAATTCDWWRARQAGEAP